MNTNNIYVSTEEQFFNALSSNRTIIIQKSLNLSSITDYELKLTGYSNLSIKGVNPSIRLGVSKGENLVLSFDSCQNISISNLVMGHEGVLDCGAGVLMFSNCSGVNISNCDIYGCGYYGVVFDRSKDAVCSNSTIHNCWLFNVDIEQSTNIKFINTFLKESKMGTILYVRTSKQIKFEKCSFIDDTHTGKDISPHSCFGLDCNITLNNCSIHYTNNIGDKNYIIQNGCRWY